ncbi:hypothetical protein HZH66_008504 [Vespula vulgaris]|uniref:Uncharacterized protein n=1 Tax=Vespula vulgaris TaxID=7454 RepID=A0A834JW67_VESVU|nr:hypothetical protein HZH66_008504 [Vespula vulgaris]
MIGKIFIVLWLTDNEFFAADHSFVHPIVVTRVEENRSEKFYRSEIMDPNDFKIDVEEPDVFQWVEMKPSDNVTMEACNIWGNVCPRICRRPRIGDIPK